MIKFSIVTISYNQASFLRDCIESVLSQNYKHFEYIVVDPGSVDGSRDIIDSYGGRIEKIYDKDCGPADGLRKGFEKATGDVFLYLNSDDMLEPDALNVFLKYLEEIDVLTVSAIIHGACKIINSCGIVDRVVYSDIFTLGASAYNSAVVIQPSSCFTKVAYEHSPGFNVRNRTNWDDELLVDMVMSGAKTYRINDVISSYRLHSDGITGSGGMASEHKKYNLKKFEKIKGRSWTLYDWLILVAYRLKKHLCNHRQLIDRIVKGPVFGASYEK
tara:strand:+ start:195 stop:1013 length:819 start_codon:yes stop_codon:yes gene_type:complete